VSRTPHRVDRRSSLVQLTPKGKKLVEAAVAAHIENERRLLASLDPQRRGQLAELLRQLLVSVGDAARRPRA
jgi:DNA-binding MarR family transcriptional regulator